MELPLLDEHPLDIKVKELYDGEQMALTQDSMELQSALTLLLPQIKNKNDYSYFWGKKARKNKSPAWVLVESASSGFSDFDNKFKAKIIVLALALGGTTLKLFKNCLRDAQDTHVLRVREMVTHLLVQIFDFNELFAKWLPEHLNHLKKGSIMILHDLKTNDFELVRYSTVVEFNDPKEKNTFESNVNILL